MQLASVAQPSGLRHLIRLADKTLCEVTLFKTLSPDHVAFIDGDPATNPIAGTYHGIEEFNALWRRFFTLVSRELEL
jgi:hypothetical protein